MIFFHRLQLIPEHSYSGFFRDPLFEINVLGLDWYPGLIGENYRDGFVGYNYFLKDESQVLAAGFIDGIFERARIKVYIGLFSFPQLLHDVIGIENRSASNQDSDPKSDPL